MQQRRAALAALGARPHEAQRPVRVGLLRRRSHASMSVQRRRRRRRRRPSNRPARRSPTAESNASFVRSAAKPNSSARYGSPFMSQKTSVTFAPGGSAGQRLAKRRGQPSPMQTVSVLIRFGFESLCRRSATRASGSSPSGSTRVSRSPAAPRPAPSPGMKPHALFSGPAPCSWSFSSSHSSVSGADVGLDAGDDAGVERACADLAAAPPAAPTKPAAWPDGEDARCADEPVLEALGNRASRRPRSRSPEAPGAASGRPSASATPDVGSHAARQRRERLLDRRQQQRLEAIHAAHSRRRATARAPHASARRRCRS